MSAYDFRGPPSWGGSQGPSLGGGGVPVWSDGNITAKNALSFDPSAIAKAWGLSPASRQTMLNNNAKLEAQYLSGDQPTAPNEFLNPTEWLAPNDGASSIFSPKPVSVGVTNNKYADYVRRYPGLMANYNANWKGKGVSLAEYGASHYSKYGKKEGRKLGGASKPKAKPRSPVNKPDTSPIGPYPEDNTYFPILTQEYTAPNASDWSQYMPQPGLFSNPNIPDLTGGAMGQYEQAQFPGEPQNVADQDYSGMGGLLYQPWSTEYQQTYVPPNLWNYAPTEFANPEVIYTRKGGPMTIKIPKPKAPKSPKNPANTGPGWDEPRDEYWGGPMYGNNFDEDAYAEMAAAEAQEADEWGDTGGHYGAFGFGSGSGKHGGFGPS